MDDGEFGDSVKAALNLPMGDTAARGSSATTRAARIHGLHLSRSQQEGRRQQRRTHRRAAALRFQPNDQLSITPRIVYQKLETDGYPRIDVWNILGNPYTTTEPPVDYDDRTQVTQLEEGIDDDFTLADLTSTTTSAP